MNNRIRCSVLLVTCCLLYAVAIHCPQPTVKNSMPITTASKEALKLYQKGMSLYDDGSYTEASEQFALALDEDPDFPMAHLRMATAALNENDRDKFEEYLAKAQGISVMNETERLLVDYYAAQIAEDAVKQKEIVEKLAADYPGNPRVLTMMGDLYRRQNQWQKAVDILLQAEPAGLFQTQLQLGMCYYNMGSAGRIKADSIFTILVQRRPDDTDILSSKAWTLRRLGKMDEAIVFAEKALAIDPADIWVHQNLGYMYLIQDNPEKALKNFQAVVDNASIYDEYRAAHYGMASYYAAVGQDIAAYEELKKRTELAEKEGDKNNLLWNYHDRGDFLMVVGDYAKAAEDYKKWLALVEESNMLEERKKTEKSNYLFNLARIALVEKDIAAAKGYLDDYLNLGIENPTETDVYHKFQGMIALAEKRYDDAIREIEQTGGYTFRLAKIYEEKGDIEKAKELYAEGASSTGSGPIAAARRRQIRQKLATL